MENQKLEDSQILELVQKSQAGDQEAFGALYDYFSDSLYKYIYFRVPNGEAEDLLETIFLKVWEKIHQYKPDKASFKSWIFRIAHNLVVDFYRLQKSVSELTDIYKDERVERNPIHLTENVLNSGILYKAFKKLKKAYSQYLLLRLVNDLSNAEIAEIMKKSEGSLRIIQFRALKALKKILKEMGFSGQDVTK